MCAAESLFRRETALLIMNESPGPYGTVPRLPTEPLRVVRMAPAGPTSRYEVQLVAQFSQPMVGVSCMEGCRWWVGASRS